MLNGKLVGERKPYDEDTGIISWDIPYQAGKLEVVGMDESGEKVSQYFIQSSERPYAIKILSEESKIEKGGVAQIAIQVVDKNEVPGIV